MKDQFVPPELSAKLRDLGFDEECLTEYMPNPFPPYKWKLQSIISTTHLNKSGQNDPHLIGFTGYRNTGIKHFGLKSISAPLWQQAFDWFREKYSLEGYAGLCHFDDMTYGYNITTYIGKSHYLAQGRNYKSYEEARLACLQKLIEVCQKE